MPSFFGPALVQSVAATAMSMCKRVQSSNARSMCEARPEYKEEKIEVAVRTGSVVSYNCKPVVH